MDRSIYGIPPVSPGRIFSLRDSSFAADLFTAAVGYFDLFNRLEAQPSDIGSICSALGISERPADVMLTLFKAYGFIGEERGIFRLTDIARHFLTAGSAYDLSSYVNSLLNRPACADMREVLRTGKPANWAAAKDGKAWAEAMEEESFAESFTAGMDSRGAFLAHGLLRAVDFIGHKKLLDIGGGSAIYSVVILESNPHMKAAVFEKPPVDRAALYAVKKRGLENRVKVVAGDMFRDSLPGGYDVHLLSHVLHDWDFREVRAILENSYENLEPGGTVIIHDAHINRAKTGPVSVAEYSVLLMFLSEGKCYSVGEMRDVLTQTGFRHIRHRRTIYNRSVITAVK